MTSASGKKPSPSSTTGPWYRRRLRRRSSVRSILSGSGSRRSTGMDSKGSAGRGKNATIRNRFLPRFASLPFSSLFLLITNDLRPGSFCRTLPQFASSCGGHLARIWQYGILKGETLKPYPMGLQIPYRVCPQGEKESAVRSSHMTCFLPPLWVPPRLLPPTQRTQASYLIGTKASAATCSSSWELARRLSQGC